MLWCGVCGHDGSVDAAFGADVSSSLILCHILPCTANLVVGALVGEGHTGVPNWNIIAAGETLVVIVEVFVGVGWIVAAPGHHGG